MFRGYLNATLTGIMMTCMVIVLIDSIMHWRRAMRGTVVKEPAVEVGD